MKSLFLAVALALIANGTMAAPNAELESPNFQGILRSAPRHSAFLRTTVKTQKELANVVPSIAASKVWSMLKRHKCESHLLTVYYSPRSSSELVVSDCYRLIEPANGQDNAIYEIPFPVMVSIEGTEVNELSNLPEFGFMYDTGELKDVTDINHNGHLELWLEGAICECDGDYLPTEPCDCVGTTILENFGGKLRVYKKK
jgi:hypothetical protein